MRQLLHQYKGSVLRGFRLTSALWLMGIFFLPLLSTNGTPTNVPEYGVTVYGSKYGLNSSDVSALFQDYDGFIWVGTVPGVSKFDGYEFINYKKAGDEAIGKINSIVQDSAGTIWVGGVNGLFYYDKGEFRSASITKNVIMTLHKDASNDLWIGGIGFVPFILSAEELNKLKTGEIIVPEPILSLSEWNKKFQSLRVWEIDTDGEGTGWIGLDHSIISYNGIAITIHLDDTSLSPKYSCIEAISSDSVFWGSEGTPLVLHNNGKTEALNAIDTYISCSTDTSLYFLTTIELIKYESGLLNSIHQLDNFDGHYFKVMIQDREGSFWIGANDILLKLTPQYIKKWELEEHPYLYSNHSITQTTDGSILIGSSKENILQFKNNDFTPVSKIGVSYNSVTNDMYQDKNGWMWYASSMDGILVERNGMTVNYREENGLGNNGQLCFSIFSNGDIWSGGDGCISQILVTDLGDITFKNYLFPTKVGEYYSFHNIVEAPNGELWAGSNKGLFTIKGDSIVKWNLEDILTPSPNVTSLAIDHNEHLWISTQGEGILQFSFDGSSDPQFIKQWGMDEGLLSDVVLAIHVDSLNYVWALSQNGICRINAINNELNCYDQTSGWSESPTSRSKVIESSNGRMWVANATSILSFPLYDLPLNSIKPNSFITKVALMDGIGNIHEYSDDKNSLNVLPRNLRLPYNKNFVDFHFTTTSHTLSNKNSFKYKLEGLDPEWRQSNGLRSALYPGLKPGKYIFKVLAINNDGIEGEHPATYAFSILAPWYRTWWALLLWGILFIYAVYSFNKIQLSKKIANQEANKLRELDEFKTRFYSNITHEFRTPLTVISGMADELGSNLKKDPQRKISLIKKNSQDLLALVNQMLDLSKLQAGKIYSNVQQGDIITFLKYLTESHQSYAKLKNVGLQFYSEENELFIDFDALQMEQVLNNLISNAVKFTNEYGNILIVAKNDSSKGKPALEIKVKDNGIGISDEQLPHIFDRFHQANPIHGNQGSGIGLALVKELMGLMNGEINVESKLHAGTTFFLRFPITNVAPLSNPVSNGRIEASAIATYNVHEDSEEDSDLPILLIIEDNPDVTYYLRTCLEDDYRIVTSANGKLGLASAIETLPDIIISDVMMPEMDGFEVCEKLKKDERTNHIPVILLTAKATSEDKLEGLTHGADAYLIKPFKKEELQIRMQKLMEIRRTLQSKYSSALLSSQQIEEVTLSKEEVFVKKLEKIILTNLDDEKFSIHHLSRKLILSRSQVHRKIKALTGMSTAIYIRNVRLQKAKELLLSTDLPISAIAYQVGFKTMPYFSQAFKDTFGESPSATRI